MLCNKKCNFNEDLGTSLIHKQRALRFNALYEIWVTSLEKSSCSILLTTSSRNTEVSGAESTKTNACRTCDRNSIR